MMALGSRPPSRKIWVSMAVVVVLPWVPDTATQRLKRLGEQAQHLRPL